MAVKISPSLLSSDFSNLGEEVRRVAAAGADSIHLDIMDGRFVPNITFGPAVVRSIRDKTDIPFIAHLMIERPEAMLQAFAEAGADVILVHAEAADDLRGVIRQIREHGIGAGVAVNPATPVRAVESVLCDIDELLVMTVNPGFGGQEFISSTLPKIAEAREMARAAGHDLDIAVDGGINPDTCGAVIEAGANVLVAGSFVAQNGIEVAIADLRRICAEADQE